MKYKLNGQWYDISVPSYDATPVGAIIPYAGTNIPTGYILCNGQSLLRTEYPDLFNAIGTTYGSVDSTHFNLPNIKGRVLVGLDTSQTEFNALGKTGGTKTNKLIPENYYYNNWLSMGITGQNIQKNFSNGADFGINTATNSNDNTPVNNLQPYIVVNYIIKAHPSAINTSEVVNEHSTSETDVYSANYLNNLVSSLFPVGKIEIFYDNNDHSNYLGFNWVRVATGRTLVGIDTSQTEFNSIGKTGGSKEMQAHHHDALSQLGIASGNGDTTGDINNISVNWQTNVKHFKVDQTIGTGNSGNLQPYIVVAYWRRTQ